MRHGRFAIADLARATSVFIVVFDHYLVFARPAVFGRIFQLRSIGDFGLSGFFVLSGYLLSAPYVRAALNGSTHLPSIRGFYVRRALRAIPLYVVAVLLSVTLDVAFRSEKIDFGNVAAHLAMLQNFFTAYVITLNGPLWTMPIDIEFYLILPFVGLGACVACRRLDATRRPVALIAMLTMIFVTSVAYRFAVDPYLRQVKFGYYLLTSNLFGLAALFALGAILTTIFELRNNKVLSQRTAAIFFVVSIVMVSAMVYADQLAPTGVVWGALAVSLLLLSLPSFEPVTRFSGTPFITTLVTLSYPIYLVHYPILEATRVVLRHRPEVPGTLAYALVIFFILIPVAYFLHLFVERPFLALKERAR